MNLKLPLSHVGGIGPNLASKLGRLGLFTIEDLIQHYPFRYDDYSKSVSLVEAKDGESVTLTGELWSINNTYTRFRKVLTKALLNDGSGPIELIWFNQPWLSKSLKAGDRLQVSGKVQKKGSKVSIMQPKWERITIASNLEPNASIHTGRLVPVYPETFGLTSKWIREKIHTLWGSAQKEIQDPLPEEFKDGMIDLTEALSQIHFPTSWELMNKAKKRLSFDELFFIQLETQYQRLHWQQKTVISPWDIDSKKLMSFIHSLPFKLTNAQLRVIDEIILDLQKGRPMNRLVQGEVGSGKTVVAAVIAYLAFLNKQKTLLMAPTEILAFQHHQTLTKLLESLGIKIGIYTGSKKELGESQADIIIGTHALLSKKLATPDVGLVIIDEQQRFGVEQRALLRQKGSSPHFLTMTATPIPRTVALTLYGDLDLSIIDELPKGRKLVKTYYTPGKKRQDAYEFIKKHVGAGEQVYIITPLIEESETQLSAKAAKVEYERLQKEVFPDLKLGLLHGRLKASEKQQVLTDFKDHQLNILVSTSVVEVGVDVPNATIMVIEGAQRFGLAQLHQLRGRVGRSDLQSFCLLFSDEESPQLVSRLKNLEKIYDGLKLAELDLKIRGGGDIGGLRQSGRWELKIAELTDLESIEKTRRVALDILKQSPNLDKYPLLQAKLTSATRRVSPD